MNTQKVIAYIMNKDIKNSRKQRMIYSYEQFCKTNNLQVQKIRLKLEYPISIIPTTENVTKIISASTRRYSVIFTILAETGLSGMELHKLPRKNIDAEQGIISVEGHKGHASGTYKLKKRTSEMLREYLAKNPQENLFPHLKAMSDAWRTARGRLADKLKQPDLNQIPMKNLRNYSGAKESTRC